MKATVYIATSLDGFIAREDGGIDWLPGEEDAQEGEDYGYQEFIDTVDAIVMGRNTYELASSFGSWPYGGKPVVVLSSRRVDIPDAIAETVESMPAEPREVVRRLAERGFGHLYVDGGKTIQGFLGEGLIQRLIITRIPVLIGTGIPLFGPLPHDVRLRHVETRQFENGLVQSEYEVLDDVA
ncbi:dihydrofolate reductase [Rubrobacter tropicus]|uniref:Dihydrofolate reductase n=1 Tax=Rubrobacter tropicus TaxID=2653851 RepID=A0A6G8QCW0_9ACTN|nr:dihydrofolate reductase family protein [Rubrobacter tropicus]QIN84319.1 dihydrofolate reductase [Rubrobacter tropicus]